MKKQAQLIFAHFGEEKQRKKAKEERLELEIALNKLALYDIREEQGMSHTYLREELINDCNEEFGDNVLMRMQLENLEFEESFEMMTISYSKTRVYHCYGIDKFYFSKEEVRKWVERKIERTMGKYGIGKDCDKNLEIFKDIINGVYDEIIQADKKVLEALAYVNKNFELKEGMKFKLTSGDETYIYSKKDINLPKGMIDWEETKKLNGVE